MLDIDFQRSSVTLLEAQEPLVRAPLQLADMGNASSSDTGAAGGGERSVVT